MQVKNVNFKLFTLKLKPNLLFLALDIDRFFVILTLLAILVCILIEMADFVVCHFH